MVKFATNASGAMLLLNLIQVTESISRSVVPLAMFMIYLIWTTYFLDALALYYLTYLKASRLLPFQPNQLC